MNGPCTTIRQYRDRDQDRQDDADAELEAARQEADSFSFGLKREFTNTRLQGRKKMDIKTVFAPGDKGWAFHGSRAQLLTIGQVRVEITDSPGTGCNGFSNFGPQKSRREQYMCVETGIGSGQVFTLGEHIFETEGECLKANAKYIAEREADDKRRADRKRQDLLNQEAELREQLAEIERLKASA